MSRIGRARLHVIGKVQKVGFRKFVKNIADKYDLKGYVKNLPSGKVKIIVEGDDNNIDYLVRDVGNPVGYAKVDNIITKERSFIEKIKYQQFYIIF